MFVAQSITSLAVLQLHGGIDLWASHEVHFQQHGSHCRMWVRPDTVDPMLLHHSTRGSTGYSGSVRLRDGKFVVRRGADRFNGKTFQISLKRLWHSSWQSGQRVVVILDNARYHHAKHHKEWREQHTARFVPDFLPSYGPGLSPSEWVWNLRRRSCLHNPCFSLLELEAVELQFAAWGLW